MNNFDNVRRCQHGFQLILTEQRINALVEIQRDVARRSWEFSVIEDAFADKRNFSYKYPANWFEGLKDAFLPSFLKKWVKYTEISFIVIYPDFQPIVENYKVYTHEQ